MEFGVITQAGLVGYHQAPKQHVLVTTLAGLFEVGVDVSARQVTSLRCVLQVAFIAFPLAVRVKSLHAR